MWLWIWRWASSPVHSSAMGRISREIQEASGGRLAVRSCSWAIAGALRRDHFGMIEGRDQVAVTREVRGQVGGGATVAAAVVREQDQWPLARLGGTPDIAREETVAGRVAGVEGVGADGERSGGGGCGCGAIHKHLMPVYAANLRSQSTQPIYAECSNSLADEQSAILLGTLLPTHLPSLPSNCQLPVAFAVNLDSQSDSGLTGCHSKEPQIRAPCSSHLHAHLTRIVCKGRKDAPAPGKSCG